MTTPPGPSNAARTGSATGDGGRTPRRGSSGLRLPLSLAAVLLVILIGRAPLPGYVVGSGPVFSLAEQIELDGADPIDGDYLFTTVQLDAATVWTSLVASFDGESQVVTRDSVLGGQDEAAFVEEQQTAFHVAEATAVALALDAVDAAVDPTRVRITGDGVGGPSAGLLIAMAVADLAADEDLARGRTISGTGAVTDDGEVVTVGGVADKIRAAEAAGATLFVLPSSQVDDARRTNTQMQVVGVDDLDDAIEVLRR